MTYEKIPLPNNCSISQIQVFPGNWKQAKKITGPWWIFYRFYDPSQPQPKQVFIKTMNAIKDVRERREAVELLICLSTLYVVFHPIWRAVFTLTTGYG